MKEKERGVMAEEEEERVEAGEVVKERGEQGNKVKVVNRLLEVDFAFNLILISLEYSS